MGRDVWRSALNWTAAVLIALVFLAAGLWKLTDPIGAAARLAQAKVPESLSVTAAVGVGTLETFTGILLLIPRFRRWGAVLSTLLLAAFMIFIGIHYTELRGAECSCFPWVKRAVGPGFFAGDLAFMLLAIGAGVWARRPGGIRPAAMLLAAVAIFAGASYGFALTRHTGAQAPATITAEDGKPVSLREGKVVIFFFDPQCLHCLAAARKFAAMNLGSVRFIGVPTANPQFADWFFGKAGLTGKGAVSKDLVPLKMKFPFDTPPVAVVLEDGYEKAMLLQFESEMEPLASLKKIGFVP
ncbi:MAG: DoxX family protein [Acidobacteriota bacterium]|nr:DoxX family protein [Acidobacteriota bacterium]